MNDWTLATLLESVWTHITRGTADRHHPARHPTLATIGTDGPELRTLVLRRADRSTGTLELHTDAASPKANQIAEDPRVALHIWLPKAQLQIRARAIATVTPGDEILFANLPKEAQLNYKGVIPGTPLPANAASTHPRFAQLTLSLTEIDALHLGAPHTRAHFTKAHDWDGQFIAP